MPAEPPVTTAISRFQSQILLSVFQIHRLSAKRLSTELRSSTAHSGSAHLRYQWRVTSWLLERPSFPPNLKYSGLATLSMTDARVSKAQRIMMGASDWGGDVIEDGADWGLRMIREWGLVKRRWRLGQQLNVCFTYSWSKKSYVLSNKAGYRGMLD